MSYGHTQGYCIHDSRSIKYNRKEHRSDVCNTSPESSAEVRYAHAVA